MSALRVSRSRLEYCLDVGHGHAEAPEAANDLSGRDLLDVVAAVARVWVDLSRVQKPGVVVVAQRLDAQMRRAGEIADRDRAHASSMRSAPTGESTRR